MSTDKFLHTAMRTSCAALCQAIGWNATQSSALDVLSDVFQRYFLDIAKRTHRYAEHCGRTDANLDDAVVVFDEMNISIPELEEYVQNFDPVPFPGTIPLFPLERESHLNFLRPGSQEVLTRPVHVHEYMPPMIVEDDAKLKRDKSEDWQSTNSNMSVTSPDKPSVGLPSNSMVDIDGEMEVDEKPSPLVNGRMNGHNGNKDSKSDDEYESDGGPHSPGPSGISPGSPKSSKSVKRNDSPGENPALKRVRMMLEEEGHPLREITSVMMTTSGYLTSSREGRLPDSKPPPNRDFFEPLPAPVVDKKKKIPTMKKIVEGVKKIDKEKENQSDKGDSGFNLFEKPDKIFSSASAAAAAASSPAAPPSSDKNKDKDGSAGGMDGEVVSTKTKEGKEKSKKDKSEKSSSKSDKKSSKDKVENRVKQKLKIFKKKYGKLKLAKASLKSFKEKPPKPPKPPKAVKVKIPKEEPNSGLDNIESDEDFGTPRSSISREESPSKKSRKNKKEKIVTPIKIKDKKLKNKLNKSPLSAMAPPPTKLSSKAFQKAAAAAALAAEQVPIFGNPDKIVPVVMEVQKKKRGRPKKIPNPFSVNFLGGLQGMEATPPPPSIRSMKFSKKMLAAQEELFVPEISINVKPPPPPDFGLIHRLPLQPGLIPAPFIPPPSLKMPNQLPPSISITPATPTITPSSPAGSRNSSQFGNLSSSVCSSVTITRIDMSNSQKLPTPYDTQSTPGIGSPNISSSNSMSISATKSSAASAASIVPIQSDSGITITPIVLEKQSGSQSSSSSEKVDRSPAVSSGTGSGLAKLEQNMRSKEQRKKDKEKRKELKKEKKKERKEKLKEKSRKIEKLAEKEKEKDRGDKIPKKEKKDKDKDKDKDKSEKKKKKDKDGSSSLPLEATVPKLTLKLQHSSTTTPVDSPNPPQTVHGDTLDHPPPRKITIKPIEETKVQRTPSPELARFSPLVTRPSKKVTVPKKSPPVVVAKPPKQQEVVSFPPTPSAGTSNSVGSSKRGRGRPPKSAAKAPAKSSSSGSSTQAGLVTETVGSYIDEHGNKIWICPACGRQDDGSPMIGCEKCDDWYHFQCVGIVEAPAETESWYCKKCVVVKNKSSNFDHRKKVSRL